MCSCYSFQHVFVMNHRHCYIVGILRMKMDWPLRLKIALGTAKGLAYLHSGPTTSTPIIHRDFKSTNILLDVEFEPRVYVTFLFLVQRSSMNRTEAYYLQTNKYKLYISCFRKLQFSQISIGYIIISRGCNF